MTILLTNLV